MCDEVKILLDDFRQRYNDIDEVKEDLDSKKELINDFDELEETIKIDPLNIFKYSKTFIINDLLKKMTITSKEYEAIKYILDNDSSNIRELPQYVESMKQLNRICDFIKVYRETIYFKINSLEKEYYEKSLFKKYDHILSESLLIEDIEEFIKYIDLDNLSISNKIQIYIWAINNNLKIYLKNDNQKVLLDKNQEQRDLVKINTFIHNNIYLLEKKYLDILSKINIYMDVSNDIKDLIINSDKENNELDINDIFTAKQVWLMKKINNYYKTCEFGKVEKYITEYESVLNTKLKIKDIDDKNEILRIIKGDN